MISYEEHERSTREVLDAIGEVIDKYAVFPNREGRDATVLWVAHSWVFKRFDSTPRLSIFSSEYGSGKSRVMDLVCGMAPKTMSAVNARPSMIYNAIEENESMVFSIDEVDNIFGTRGSKNASKQLLAVLNEGFTSDGTTMSGTPGNYRELSLYTPIVTAGVGLVPDSFKTRSIRIPMRKAGDTSNIEEYRSRKVKFEFSKVKKVLTKWARVTGPALELVFPEMPLRDRDADKWEPLFAIAEIAGGDWLKRVSRAARLLERDDAGDDIPMSVRMLRDIETYIEENDLSEGDRVFTKNLQEGLRDLGWDERFIRDRAIAKVVGGFGIEPGTVRVGKATGKGYKVSDLLLAVSES